MPQPLLQVKNLKTYFYTGDGLAKAVDGVSFEVEKGHTLGLVGESGCGKSVTSLSIMRLIANPPGKIAEGEIWFNGQNLLKLSGEDMRRLRGHQISMIFQEPMTSLNPVFTCGDQIQETIRIHEVVSQKEARERTIELLRKVGIPAPEYRVDEYPHRLSGGMRQRVMIAMALACNPSLLIADEPTTALDVTVQAQILDLLQKLQQELHMAMILITHDLGIIAEVADHVAVMYAGQIIERGQTADIFKNPRHPYTRGLLNSIPRLIGERKRLEAIPGVVPNPTQFPDGCRFHPRCSRATDLCRQQIPTAVTVSGRHQVSCWNHDK